MSPGAPFLVVVLVVIIGVAVCLMAAAIMVPDMLSVGAWPVLAGAVVPLVCALSALWVIPAKRGSLHKGRCPSHFAHDRAGRHSFGPMNSSSRATSAFRETYVT